MPPTHDILNNCRQPRMILVARLQAPVPQPGAKHESPWPDNCAAVHHLFDGDRRSALAGAKRPIPTPHLPAAHARLTPATIGGVMPFRYAELENLPANITAEQLAAGSVRQIATHYPFDDTAADFASSSEKLNAVWAFCKYSMKATSFAG